MCVQVGAPEDLVTAGSLEHYNKEMDRVTPKTERPVKRFVKRVFRNVHTAHAPRTRPCAAGCCVVLCRPARHCSTAACVLQHRSMRSAAPQHALSSTAACVQQHCSVRSAAPQHTLSSTAACVQQQRRAHCLPGRLAAVPSQAPLLRRRADGLIPAIPARPATGHHVRGPRAAAAGCRGRRPGIRHGQHPVGADVRTAQRVRVRAAWPPSPRGQPSIASRPSPASPS